MKNNESRVSDLEDENKKLYELKDKMNKNITQVHEDLMSHKEYLTNLLNNRFDKFTDMQEKQ